MCRPDKENKVLSFQNDRPEVFLTIIFGVSVSEKSVRDNLSLLIDTDSQNNYIRKNSAKMLNLEKLGIGKIKHGLFGGMEILEDQNCYKFNLNRCK
jgi:hypothetical protein